MKKTIYTIIGGVVLSLFLFSCSQNKEEAAPSEATSAAQTNNGPSAGNGAASVKDEVSQPNVVKVAVGSKDHTTLVKAVQAADLVDVLAQSGPYTVFAPTNAAFDQLPAGTVDGLLKPEKKADLRNILQYHVTTSKLKLEYLKDGQQIPMVDNNNSKATIHVKDGKYMINDANVVGTVDASNGVVYVIDKVLLPPTK
ncbi:MAG TPA: fasciclin domain-containing protein [Bacteroidia bacterium]